LEALEQGVGDRLATNSWRKGKYLVIYEEPDAETKLGEMLDAKGHVKNFLANYLSYANIRLH
jgi:hypothetical protein